jgi:hypothetical protein
MLTELAEPFNRLPVEMNKFVGAQLLWRDSPATRRHELSDGQFVDNYSWLTKSNFLDDKTRVRTDITATMFAERYGGVGLATNGGGARVVNLADVQIKGVGANALAGQGTPSSHSYGGLDIQGAVKEIIYSRLLNKISPVGVQAIEGLILLDATSALHDGNKAPSVLLVRERVARPGHFLPCVNFRPKPEHRSSMQSDYSRVLGIYKSIGRHALLSDFYILVQHFLDKCADQLSFFRVARLVHGALTPSNLCLDGRVLDTGLCSFIVSGTNYGQVTSYFDEAATPPLVIREWFYLIGKFLTDKPVEDHFFQLYDEKLCQYAFVNIGFMFGVDREMSTKLAPMVEWRKVASRLLYLLSKGSLTKTSELPTVDAADFVNDVLTASLYSILSGREIPTASRFLADFTGEVRALITMMAPSFTWHGQGEQSFCRSFAIQTVKRAVLSSFFFITYIGRTVDDHYAAGGIDDSGGLIDSNARVADWIFENLVSERSTLYSGNGVSIQYCSSTDDFIYRDAEGTERRTADVRTLRAIVDQNSNGYIVHNYDFKPYLRRILALLDGDAENCFNGVKNVFR